jgi:3-methyladenine DNA glycosylase AlkD
LPRLFVLIIYISGMNLSDVIDLLKEQANPTYLNGMARFGIDSSKAIGVKVPEIRKIAKAIKKDHDLAMELWASEIHEARLLATMIADSKQLTLQQMDKWVNDFYSWDICDQACGNLFDQTDFAVEKAVEYCASEKEFVKRAGFVLIAEFAVHNKKAPDDVFIQFFPLIEREAWDNRNFVKKAVNWSLRQIGKRNRTLNQVAIAVAKRIAQQDSKAAKWIAADALAELTKRF